MPKTYKLSVDECEKLIGHCWDTSASVSGFSVTLPPAENREETSKQCAHCGLREIRKVHTTYRFEKPSD